MKFTLVLRSFCHNASSHVPTPQQLPPRVRFGSRRANLLPRGNLPPFMLSRSEPKMSDEEFEQRIIELAKRDQAAGRFHCKDPSSELNQLRFSYISVVSPDREGMINNALPMILGNANTLTRSMTPNSMCPKELIWKLLLGIEIPPVSNLNLGQRRLLFELKDADGNSLATLTTDGWSMTPTPAENARACRQ